MTPDYAQPEINDDDPLLVETTKRFVPFPIEHDDLWGLYKEAQASYWTAEEIDLGSDKFDELTPDEQHFVKHVLAFFAASDGIVQENLAFSVDSFMGRVQAAEARAFYSFQVAIEQVHARDLRVALADLCEGRPRTELALQRFGDHAVHPGQVRVVEKVYE